MKRDLMKAPALRVFALLSGALGMSCSGSVGTPNVGSFRLAVVLPGGVHIDQVTYQVLSSANATVAGQGTFGVTDPNAAISLDLVVPATPAGDAGDEVVLTATDSLGDNCTGTSLRFTVSAGANPPVLMTLTCGNGAPPGQLSSVGITANVIEADRCPTITSAVVAPQETTFTSPISVAASASDADLGETLTYAWTPAAQFADPTALSTQYACATPGAHFVTVSVTDSHQPPCTQRQRFVVQCDDPLCGDGIVEASEGEQCDPPNVGFCDANCQQTLEKGMTCIPCEFSGVDAGSCFNTSAPGHGATVADFGCFSLQGADVQACQNLHICLQSQACQDAIQAADASYSEGLLNYDFPLPCLCGNVSETTCVSMSAGWTGVCAPQYLAASRINPIVSFTDNSTAEGVAVNLFSCDIDSSCQTNCGIPQ